MALTDTAAKNAKADPAKPAGAKLTDGQGLYLLVKSAGKYWRFDYRFADKRKMMLPLFCGVLSSRLTRLFCAVPRTSVSRIA